MGVGAVAEATVLGKMEDVLEVAGELLRLDVEGAESLDARCVDDIATGGQGEHLAEGSGVHARVVDIADFRRAEVGAGQDTVERATH